MRQPIHPATPPRAIAIATTAPAVSRNWREWRSGSQRRHCCQGEKPAMGKNTQENSTLTRVSEKYLITQLTELPRGSQGKFSPTAFNGNC